MSAAENKAVIDRFNVALNEGNLDVIDAIFDPNFVGHSTLSPEPMRGPGEYKAFLAAFYRAMPDLQYPHWTLIAEGDLVVIHMPAEGTFTSELMGIPPNGKKMSVWMANIWRFSEGKIVEWWFNIDTLGLMQQLGAIPPMG
jgi:steroid delta-isomerase-like uncharacterized protein